MLSNLNVGSPCRHCSQKIGRGRHYGYYSLIFLLFLQLPVLSEAQLYNLSLMPGLSCVHLHSHTSGLIHALNTKEEVQHGKRGTLQQRARVMRMTARPRIGRG
jgi:hypothetical protein